MTNFFIRTMETRTFSYEDIDIEDLTATDLREIAVNSQAECNAFSIRIPGAPEAAQALYFPVEHRLGIAWGADATWADVDDIESGIDMWINDPEEWNSRN